MTLEETRLKADDVVAKLVVLCLDGLVRLRELFVLLYLVLERFDIFFLPLTERALGLAN